MSIESGRFPLPSHSRRISSETGWGVTPKGGISSDTAIPREGVLAQELSSGTHVLHRHGSMPLWPAIGRGLLAATAIAAVACGGTTAPQATNERPWEGTPVSDADFEAMLRPEEPVESAGLFAGTDEKIHYVAHLRDKPARGFVEAYRKVIRSRGFLIAATGDSTHYALPRTTGYRFVVLKKGPIRPFTLFNRRFQDSGPLAYPRSYPYPIDLHGRTLVVKLGPEALEPWEKTVVVPEEDVVKVKEFFFPRFPGAVLTRDLGPEDDDDLRRDYLTRVYVARGASIEDIVAHYRNVLEQQGIPVRPDQDRTPELSWFSRENPLKGLYTVSIDRDFLLVARTELTTEDLTKWAPAVLEGCPTDVVPFKVSVGFVSNEGAAAYWTAEQQARREALLAKEGK